MTKQEHFEEIRYELFSIQKQAIYLRNMYGDKDFLHNITGELFLATTRIFIIENYQFYAKMSIQLKESIGFAHIYHQSILDSFENIYVSHREFTGQDF